MLGLGALFLSMSVEYAPEIYSLLFGELFGVGSAEVVPVAVLGAVSVAAIIVMYRPLMLTSVMPELAAARGVSSYRIEMCFLVVVALATSMTLPVVGALLIFSLMIGPPAAARSVTSRPYLAMCLSVLLALGDSVGGDRAVAACRTGPSGSSSEHSAPAAMRPGAAGPPGSDAGQCATIQAGRSPRNQSARADRPVSRTGQPGLAGLRAPGPGAPATPGCRCRRPRRPSP